MIVALLPANTTAEGPPRQSVTVPVIDVETDSFDLTFVNVAVQEVCSFSRDKIYSWPAVKLNEIAWVADAVGAVVDPA